MQILDNLIASIDSMTEESKQQSTIDPCSYSNLNEVRSTHIHLNLAVDFEKRVLSGYADLTLKCVSKQSVSSILLDSRELDIKSVSLVGVKDAQPTALKWEYLAGNAKVPSYGRPLKIALSNALPLNDEIVVRIEYATSPSAEAIQWLTPEQTAGKKYPYLFTQCQAIGARTLLPCQDSPGAKCPYSAQITVHDRNLVALMSALRDGDNKQDNKAQITYRFKQSVPCCSYLIALVVGNLERRDIDARCAIYCEPDMIEAAQYEFANTGKMLDIAESICGEYVWQRYDLLMLPPSFPYGGMENPNLTFVTPTLIAGDRSLENVVAHEITHSWTGNLVTNSSWEHFWLNEGWTRFIESKIMGKLKGADHEIVDIASSQITLKQAVERLGAQHEFTKLNLSLLDTDPDDAFSSIPYEKGSEFLRYLEDLVGGPQVMADFIKKYIAQFQYKCLDTYAFKQFFIDYFSSIDGAKDKLSSIDWNTWLKAPGMPPVLRKVESKLIRDAQQLVAKWSVFQKSDFTANADDIKAWTVDQIVMFLDDLLSNYQQLLQENKINKEQIKQKEMALKATYKFHESTNAEILFRLNLIALECDDESQYGSVQNMLSSVGRMKFVRPTYRGLIKNPARQKLAEDIYEKNKHFYHPICAKMVGQDLKQK